jgi:hypothetical protein
MASLTFQEKRLLENFLQMSGGYVLDFVDRTFQEFIGCTVKKDIDNPIYSTEGGSKAKRMRYFWKHEDDRTVGRLLLALTTHAETLEDTNPEQANQARAIGRRLLDAAGPVDLSGIEPLTDDETFEVLAEEVREKIEQGHPDRGLDRLHTFTVRLFRHLHEKRGHTPDRDKPLHSLAGEYAKMLERSGKLQSPMTVRVIRVSIGLLQDFCSVRNNESLAHDNALLNRAESLLICNQICSLIRFLRELEDA